MKIKVPSKTVEAFLMIIGGTIVFFVLLAMAMLGWIMLGKLAIWLQ